MAAGLLLVLPCAILAVLIGGVGKNSGAGFVYLILFEGFLIALVMGFILVGLPALLGALVLKLERRQPNVTPLRTITLMVLTLAVTNSALILALVYLLKIFEPRLDMSLSDLGPSIFSTVGWGVGLLVSGFPDILKRAPAVAMALNASPARASHGDTV